MKKDWIYKDSLKRLLKAGNLYKIGMASMEDYHSVLFAEQQQNISSEEREKDLADCLYYLSLELEDICYGDWALREYEDNKGTEPLEETVEIRNKVLKVIEKVEDLIGDFPEEPEDPYAWPFDD